MEERGWKSRERHAAIPPREEENRGETPHIGKRERRARSERGERGREDLETDKRTHGAVDGVRSRGRRREGLRAGLQTGKPALQRQTDGGSCA